MLKSALSRQSRLCRLPITARPLQLASQIPTRSLLARSTRSRTGAVSRHGLPGLWTRSYSALANATVPAEEVDGSAEGAAAGASEADGVVTRFENLSSLGVHENVVRSITEGMGYETMSQVQSMTIQPALAGKDMYELPSRSPFRLRIMKLMAKTASPKPRPVLARPSPS